MKKKNFPSNKDKQDWIEYTKKFGDLYDKESDLSINNKIINKTRKIDLHGYSLSDANIKVDRFINESFANGYKKLLIVTGKGLRSKVYDDPYRSEKMSVLRYSIPEFIRSNKNLSDKINKITIANVKDGGDGAMYIFLKNKFR